MLFICFTLLFTAPIFLNPWRDRHARPLKAQGMWVRGRLGNPGLPRVQPGSVPVFPGHSEGPSRAGWARKFPLLSSGEFSSDEAGFGIF